MNENPESDEKMLHDVGETDREFREQQEQRRAAHRAMRLNPNPDILEWAKNLRILPPPSKESKEG